MSLMAFKALLLLLLTQTAFAQSCNQTATFSLVVSPYKTRTYAALSSSNCSSGSGPFDFTVVNPSSHQFAYYASEGLQCSDYYFLGMYWYDKAYSKPNGTNASFVSAAQVPCILYPCCVILQCQSSLGCPNLTLNTLWKDVQPLPPLPSFQPRPSSNSTTTPSHFNYAYVYYPVGGVSALAIVAIIIRFLQCTCVCIKCFAKENDKPELSVPIVPAEETPLKIRKPRKATADGHV